MELHPTPESWRVALFTMFGATVIAVVGVWFALVFSGTPALLVGGILVALAGIATVLPAIGALSATVDVNGNGVAIRRFGRESRYAWSEIDDVHLATRRANVPDGTEYHWIVPNRRTHVVAVPCLTLADGRVREIPALAGPAHGSRSHSAVEHAALLTRVRALHGTTGDGPPADDTAGATPSRTGAETASTKV